MSFILDALRKSETARRRSEAPDLFTTMPSAPVHMSMRPQWPMWTLGIIGILSLIAALWLFAQQAPLSASRDTTNDVATSDVAADTAPTTTPAAAQPIVVPPPATVVVTPAPAANAAPESPVTPRVSPSAPATAPPAPDIAPMRDLPAPPESPVAQAAAPPPALQITPATPPTGDQIVSLSDLDPDSRKQLPPLKLSMHLWNESPSQRFVILDGQRLKEGDVLGDIVIEQITRDGALLNWRSSRLKIELR